MKDYFYILEMEEVWRMKGRLLLFLGLLFVMLGDANAATTVDQGSFGTIYDVFKAWIGGSLGYIIALLGTIGSIIWYLIGSGVMGGSPKALLVGISISFFCWRSCWPCRNNGKSWKRFF